jgi:hypothetical protein
MLEARFDDAHSQAAGPSTVAILQGLAKVNNFKGFFANFAGCSSLKHSVEPLTYSGEVAS